MMTMMIKMIMMMMQGLLSAITGEESYFVIDGSGGGSGEPVVSMSGLDSSVPVQCRQVSCH